MDANGFGFLSKNSITVVKPLCKKKNSPKRIKEAKDSSFSQGDHSLSQILVLSSFCNPQFQLEFSVWETGIQTFTSIVNFHFTSTLSYRFLDNDLPPPKFS